MADIKLKTLTVIDPKLSEEKKAEIQAAFDKIMVGAAQDLKGKGRIDFVNKFVAFLDSQNAESVQRLEAEIKELHGMEKVERFRTHLYLLLIDVFQSGMLFALDKRAQDNQLDLLKVIGFDIPQE